MTNMQKAKSNEKWESLVNDFLFANYDFEYFIAKREMTMDGTVCNYIRFPKAENGRLVNKAKLQNVIDTIWLSDVKDKIFGKTEEKPNIVDFNNSLFICWNILEIDDFANTDDKTIDTYYRY